MQVTSLLPNFQIMRYPSNWFLVAFSLILFVLIWHFLKGNNS